jgi:hypothetical protein
MDQFISFYKQQDQRIFIYNIYNRVVSFLITSLYIDTNNFVPLYIKSQAFKALSITIASAPKSISFAGIAKTLKNLGADFYSVSGASSSILKRAFTLISGGGASLTSLGKNNYNTK